MTSKSKYDETLLAVSLRKPQLVNLPIRKHQDFKPLLTSQTKCGVEFEVERVVPVANHLPEALDILYGNCWTTHEDGSLRNHGREWVTNTGLTVEQVTIALGALDAVWKKIYPELTANSRTGTHIHLNCLDLTARQISSIIMLYCLVERSLFEFSGGRTKNIFCVPIRDSITSVGNILRMGSKMGNLVAYARLVPKYAALNVGALASHGTLEFRHACGTTEPLSILPWLDTVVTLFDYGKRQDFDELLSRVKELNSNSRYEDLAREFLPDVFIRRIGHDKLVQDMSKGCSFIKECMVAPEVDPGRPLEAPANVDLRPPLGNEGIFERAAARLRSARLDREVVRQILDDPQARVNLAVFDEVAAGPQPPQPVLDAEALARRAAALRRQENFLRFAQGNEDEVNF